MGPLMLLVLMVTVVTQVSTANLSCTARTKTRECRIPAENTEEVLSCYGCLGEPLYLYLANDQFREEVKLKKVEVEGDKRLHIRSLNKTGKTLMLAGAERGQEGRYQLDIYYTNGTLLRSVSLILEIQAPVSEPALSLLCLSGGKTEVTCSSEGDRVEYNWSLDDQSLTVQSARNSTITLEGHLTGNLTCEVQNIVSSSRTMIQLSTCTTAASLRTPTNHFISVAVTVAVAALLLFSSLLLGIRHLFNKTRSQPVTSGADGEDIVYTEVRVVKRDRRRRPVTPPVSDSVTYGHIKMADCP